MDIKPKKRLGQNFLVDLQVVEDLLDAAEIADQDTVLEVGAGTGIVTEALAKRAGQVVAVELDQDLIPQLQANPCLAGGRVSGLGNVKIINADILALKIDTEIQRYKDTKSFKVVGSIPYQITSPLIHKLLKGDPRARSITIIVQKEVAEKVASQPPKAAYSAPRIRGEEQGSQASARGSYLSNFVANFGEAEIIRTIKPDAFRPQPKVESAILRVTLHPTPRIADPKFESFLHHGFAQPRKMLNKRFDAAKLKEAGIDPARRPQTLGFDEWVKLFGAVRDGGGASKATLSRPRPSSAE